jgi:hypothetical protein
MAERRFRAAPEQRDPIPKFDPRPTSRADVAIGTPAARRFRRAQEDVRDVKMEERRRIRAGSFKLQGGLPIAQTPSGRFEEFTGVPDLPLGGEPAVALTRGEVAGFKTDEGRIEKLGQDFPNYTFTTLQDPFGGNVISVHRPGQTEATLLDSTDLTTLADYAEVGGMVWNMETLGTIAGVVATKGRKLLPRIAGQFGGAATGRAADIALRDVRGFEKTALDDMALDAAISGAAAGVGELVFAPVRAFTNGLMKGRGAIQLSETDIRANRALIESGIKEGLPLGSLNPLLESMERMAGRTSSEIRDQRLRESEAVLNTIKTRQDRLATIDLTEVRDEELETIVNQASADLMAVLGAETPNPAQGRRAIELAKNHVNSVFKASTDKKYTKAFEHAEGVSFNAGEAHRIGTEALEGVQAKKNQLLIDRQVVAENERRRMAKKPPMSDAEIEAISGKRISIDPDGPLAKQINDLLELDPLMEGFNNNSAFEAIKTIRSQLYQLKTPAPGVQPNPENHIAGELWSALTEAMNNPIGGSPRFKELYRGASSAHARRDYFMNSANFRSMALSNKFDDAAIFKEIVRPYNGTFMRAMQRLAPEQWGQVQEAFKQDLLARPERILSTLDEYRVDPKALRSLITPQEEDTLRAGGRAWELWQSNPMTEAVAKVAIGYNRHTPLAEKGTASQIREFYNKVGGKDTAQGEALRGAAMQRIVHASQAPKQFGFDPANFKAMNKIIGEMEDNGQLAAIFKPDEVAFLQDRRLVASYLQTLFEPAGAGTSLQVATMGANIMGTLQAPVQMIAEGTANPFETQAVKGATGAVGQALANFYAAKFAMNPRFRNFIIGTKNKPADLTALRAMTSLMFETGRDIMESSEQFRELGLTKGGENIVGGAISTVQKKIKKSGVDLPFLTPEQGGLEITVRPPRTPPPPER